MSTAEDVQLNYERRGAGTPLVLLHGIGHRWQAWEPVLDKLAREHDVIAVDLPGFGESPVVPGADRPATLASAIAKFFGQLGLDHPHVAGNSLGGAIALELAASGVVSTATVLCPAGFASPREGRRALFLLSLLRRTTMIPTRILRGVLRLAWMRVVAFAMIVHRPRRLTFERAFGDALALRNCPGFAMVARQTRGYSFSGTPQVPVTVAWARHDRVLPYRQAARARSGLPGARHVELPGCGHVPMTDAPDLVASAILATTKGA